MFIRHSLFEPSHIDSDRSSWSVAGTSRGSGSTAVLGGAPPMRSAGAPGSGCRWTSPRPDIRSRRRRSGAANALDIAHFEPERHLLSVDCRRPTEVLRGADVTGFIMPRSRSIVAMLAVAAAIVAHGGSRP